MPAHDIKVEVYEDDGLWCCAVKRENKIIDAIFFEDNEDAQNEGVRTEKIIEAVQKIS